MRALENVVTDFTERFPGFTGKVVRNPDDDAIHTITLHHGESQLIIEVIETEDPESPNVLVLQRDHIGYGNLRIMMNYFMRRLTRPPKSSRSSGQPLSRDLSSEFDRVQ